MSKLATESCTVCDANADEIPESEKQQLLLELPEWIVLQVDGVQKLQKTYRFKDFLMALDFANAIGDLAEGADHHPSILVEWGQTTVTWWTHTVNGLHRNDFVMAAKTDYLHGK